MPEVFRDRLDIDGYHFSVIVIIMVRKRDFIKDGFSKDIRHYVIPDRIYRLHVNHDMDFMFTIVSNFDIYDLQNISEQVGGMYLK